MRTLAGLSLALLLAACGRGASGPASTGTPSSALTPPPAAAVSAPAEKPAESAAQLLKRPENGRETVDEATGDLGSHNGLLAAVVSTVAAAAPASATEQTGNGAAASGAAWQDGVNYTRIVPAQPTDVAPGQVEVLEFFWYACPHCSALDPAIEEWRKNKPAYITFNRVPVTWGEGHRALAHLFCTVKSLGKLDTLHPQIFHEIHVNGDPLIAPDPGNGAQNEQIEENFVAKLGVAGSSFRQAFDSMDVTQCLQRSDELVQRYRIDGVPTFIVNGKYRADVASAGGPDKLLRLVGDLATQEHKHP